MMHSYKKFIILIFAICNAFSAYSQKNPIDYVNPNIGTIHSRWFFYTPAAEPFGMAKLGPSTNGSEGNPSGWEAVGYEDKHTSIEGFVCFHEFQVGGVMIMPTVGTLKTIPGKMGVPNQGYRSNFDKKDEIAKPGYYSVILKDYKVKAELTATARVGFQRFTFPASDASHIIFDIGNKLGESGEVKATNITYLGNNRIEGYVTTYPEYVKKYQTGASVSMYFYAIVSKAPKSVGAFNGATIKADMQSTDGVGSGLYLTFNTKDNETIDLKIGLSYTSTANAKLNLETEAAKLSFDKALKNTTAKWKRELGKIKVSGGTKDNKIKFYTGLFHAILGRGLASDVNGAYPRNDETVGQIELDKSGKPKFNHYNTDAMWGGYWNLGLLWSIAYPEYYNDFINSQLLVYKETGWLGDGIACSKYVSGVGTNMVSIIMAAAYLNGIRNYNVDLAYEAALKNELESKGRIQGAGKMDVGAFVERGYIPFRNNPNWGTTAQNSQFSVSHVMEYSFSAYAVAQWAKALGKEDDYKKMMKLSNNWTNLYDTTVNLIRPRVEDGSFIDNFNPLESWRGFQEGNAVQYTFFVPQNVKGLITKFGKEAFNNRLDSIFTISRQAIFGGGKVVNAFSGLATQYNHGNQPGLHTSWLFNFSGKPWLTQKWTRLICEEFYGTTGEHGYGYGQDEDQGQLGAWFVMASMGLFDVKGGACLQPTMLIGSPLFDKIEISLSPVNSKGKKFIIETENNKAQNYYIQSAVINGKELKNCWFLRDEIYKGGTLKLKMGAEPNAKWGVDTAPIE